MTSERAEIGNDESGTLRAMRRCCRADSAMFSAVNAATEGTSAGSWRASRRTMMFLVDSFDGPAFARMRTGPEAERGPPRRSKFHAPLLCVGAGINCDLPCARLTCDAKCSGKGAARR